MPAVKSQARTTQKRKPPSAPKKKPDAKPRYYFDKAKADRAVGWIEDYCTHPKGDLTGQPLLLPKWAKEDVIRPAFGWMKPTGKRKYTIVYVEIPRGNAKSTIGSGIGIYCLAGDGELTPEVYCAAGSKDQAGKVFEPMKIMVAQNEDLNTMLRVMGFSIVDDETFGFIKVVSADAKLQHGHNASAVIFDELHIQPNGKLYESFTTGNMKRSQPLIFIFTTAGEIGSFAEIIHDYAVKVRDGLVEDERFLPVIYAADPGDNIWSLKTWKKANPGWEYLNQDEFRAMAKAAKNSALFLNSFKRYNLNIWTGADIVWMPDARFMKGHGTGFNPDDLFGRECWVGLDLSSNVDTTAAIYLFPPVSEGERWKVITRVFIPYDSLQDRAEKETEQYMQWAKDGHIILTPGENQRLDLVREDIYDMATKYKIRCVGYDSYNAGETATMIEDYGIKTNAYPQNYKFMTPPMMKLETMFNKHEIEHNAHPVLRWHCQCLEAITYIRGGATFCMPTKRNDNKHRIDAMVALIIAMGTATWYPTIEKPAPTVSTILTHGPLRVKRRR